MYSYIRTKRVLAVLGVGTETETDIKIGTGTGMQKGTDT